jgi:hypothetical protein
MIDFLLKDVTRALLAHGKMLSVTEGRETEWRDGRTPTGVESMMARKRQNETTSLNSSLEIHSHE